MQQDNEWNEVKKDISATDATFTFKARETTAQLKRSIKI